MFFKKRGHSTEPFFEVISNATSPCFFCSSRLVSIHFLNWWLDVFIHFVWKYISLHVNWIVDQARANIFIGRTDVEAETSILWPSDVKSWLTGKDCDTGKYRRQEEKGETEENKMVGWYHWLNGHEFELTLGDSEGQGSLVCCSPLGHKELNTT